MYLTGGVADLVVPQWVQGLNSNLCLRQKFIRFERVHCHMTARSPESALTRAPELQSCRRECRGQGVLPSQPPLCPGLHPLRLRRDAAPPVAPISPSPSFSASLLKNIPQYANFSSAAQLKKKKKTHTPLILILPQQSLRSSPKSHASRRGLRHAIRTSSPSILSSIHVVSFHTSSRLKLLLSRPQVTSIRQIQWIPLCPQLSKALDKSTPVMAKCSPLWAAPTYLPGPPPKPRASSPFPLLPPSSDWTLLLVLSGFHSSASLLFLNALSWAASCHPELHFPTNRLLSDLYLQLVPFLYMTCSPIHMLV